MLKIQNAYAETPQIVKYIPFEFDFNPNPL